MYLIPIDSIKTCLWKHPHIHLWKHPHIHATSRSNQNLFIETHIHATPETQENHPQVYLDMGYTGYRITFIIKR